MSEPSKSPFNQETSQKAVRAILSQTNPEDYDGHTEFSRMSPLERLRWLDQAVLFIATQKGVNLPLQVAEDSAEYKAE